MTMTVRLCTFALALLGAAGCVDDPGELGVEEQGVGSGSGSNACRIVALSPTTCNPAAGRCLEGAPVSIPPWRATPDPEPTRFGERCATANAGEVRCGWGESCQTDGDPLGTAKNGVDAITAINHQVWCTPDDDTRWSMVARHANGAITSPPRVPSDPTGSLSVPATTSGASGPGAPRLHRPPRTPVMTGWGATTPSAAACAATVPYHPTTNPGQRMKELGSWRATGCTAAEGHECNPPADDGSGGDRIWFVFADGVNSLEWTQGWATFGPDAYIRPGIREAMAAWFTSNGFRHVERAVYLNNHGIFDFDSDARTTDWAGPGGIPDNEAGDAFAQILLDARECHVDYVSVVTHSNGVYTAHVGLTAVADELQDTSIHDMTIAVHHTQAAVLQAGAWPHLIPYGTLGGESVHSSDVDVHYEFNWWWTSMDIATWQAESLTHLTDMMFDALHLSVMKDHLKFGHNAVAAYMDMAYPEGLRHTPNEYRMRSMETDNCYVHNDFLEAIGVCVLSSIFIGPFHDAVDMLEYVAKHGTDDYRVCTIGSNPWDEEDCYGFPWETNADEDSGTLWPQSATGWRSKYFPGAVRSGTFCAHPPYYGSNAPCAN